MREALKNNSMRAFVFAVIVACIVFVLTHVFFQNTTSRVIVAGVFPADTLVTVHSLSGSGKSSELDSFIIKAGAGKATRGGTRVMNLPIKKLRIQFELEPDAHKQLSNNKPLDFTLSQIQVIKPYQNHYYYSGKYIAQGFQSSQSIDDSGRRFTYGETQTVLDSRESIGEPNWLLVLGVTALFFVAVFLLARNTSLLSLPAFEDMSLGNKISSSGEFNSINGLRGLAALLVILSHTAPEFESVQVGLALLFVISGFLLSKPFVLDSQKIFRWDSIERYVVKRLKRILPMYYLYIFLIYVVTFEFDTAIRHFFFVQSAGHLWPMTQIFAFYMMLPFVLLLTSYTYRFSRFLPVAILAVFIYLSVVYMGSWTPFYNGLYSHKFFLYAFFIGVLSSYIQYDWIAKYVSPDWGNRWSREALGIVAALITFYIIAWSAPMKPSPEIFHWVSQFWLKCIVSAAIILLALNTPKTAFQWLISNWLFRSVGVIGFSFYILHGLGMQIFEQIQIQYLASPNAGERSWEFLLGSFCVSYAMAVITYSFVERPFFGYREKNQTS